MNISTNKTNVLVAGFAIFSMFFGAGNLIFPPFIGLKSGSKALYGFAGLSVTAVIFVLLGLMAMILFQGDHHHFFGRLGKIPGFLTSALMLGLMGPFTAIPRAITVGYAILKQHIPSLLLPSFSFLFLMLTFFIARKKHKVIRSLGIIISPVLFIALCVIIIKGIIYQPVYPSALATGFHAFKDGFYEGYSTMDLIAALHFAPIAIMFIKHNTPSKDGHYCMSLGYLSLQASLVAGILLAITYAGLSYIGAIYGPLCYSRDLAEMFSSMVFYIMGQNASWLLDITVLMAILSTCIALSAIFADFLEGEIFYKKIPYTQSLIITLLISFLYSNFGLATIISFAQPILEVCYPPLIVLVLCNITYKLWGFKPVKLPVALTLILSLLFRYYS